MEKIEKPPHSVKVYPFYFLLAVQSKNLHLPFKHYFAAEAPTILPPLVLKEKKKKK